MLRALYSVSRYWLHLQRICSQPGSPLSNACDTVGQTGTFLNPATGFGYGRLPARIQEQTRNIIWRRSAAKA